MRRGIRLCAWVGLAVALISVAAWLLCPKPTLYGDTGFSTAVYARNGELLRLTLAPDDRYRLFTPLEDIAPEAIEATLRYEDQWFFIHPGFNPLSLLHAAWVTYVLQNRVTGGSTITMQLARLRFNIDSSTIPGKIVQILRAIQLERHYSKREILEAYLNLAPYGGNVEGMGTASLIYFGKPAAALTTVEALSLAVVPQDPNSRYPRPNGGPEELRAARIRLYKSWLKTHPDDADLSQRVGRPILARSRDDLPFRAPHFVRMVLQRHPDGGRVYTTLKPKMQHLVERRIDRYIASHGHLGIHNAAVMIVDTRDASVRALAGSADWFNVSIHGQVNGATAQRSPGSAMKPFIYALGLQEGLIHPMTLMKDAPARYGAWSPENFDHGFMGPILARDALVYSRNVPAVALAARLSHPDLYALLQQAGVDGLAPRGHYGLALALGGFEISMMKISAMYAALAHGGELRPLTLLKFRATPRPGQRLISPEASFITLQMLSRNPKLHPAPEAAEAHEPWVAWKTGTSSGFRDAWSIGVLGHFVIAVWAGNFSGEGNPAFVGRTAAGPLLFSLVNALVGRHPELARPPSAPEGLNVRRIKMCAPTGGLPGRYCPHTTKAWFIPGVSPITVSNIYRTVRINPDTGLRLCMGMPGPATTKVYAFWPSDLLELFHRAGLPRRTPPSFAPGCAFDQTAVDGQRPRIVSPQYGAVHALRPDRLNKERIAFHAVTGTAVQRVYWFVDNRYVGHTAPGETLLWQAEPGDFLVRAVDDLGRADTARLQVRLLPETEYWIPKIAEWKLPEVAREQANPHTD